MSESIDGKRKKNIADAKWTYYFLFSIRIDNELNQLKNCMNPGSIIKSFNYVHESNQLNMSEKLSSLTK